MQGPRGSVQTSLSVPSNHIAQIEHQVNTGEIVRDLRFKRSLTDLDLRLVLNNLINRMRFHYTWQDIAQYVLKCMCCRRKRSHKGSRSLWEKRLGTFDKGEHKLWQELDVLTLLRSIRQTKLLTQAMLDQRQRMLLLFQRKNLIETSSSSCDTDDANNPIHLPSQMEARNPQVRLAILGKIKRMIESYKGYKVKNIDRRLLRGLFLRNLKDFDEDY